jgi:hypothetical protein
MGINYARQLYLDQIWEERFNELLKYRDLYGTVIVPHRNGKLQYPEWERKLASWSNTQRQKYKKGKLFDWRYSKLVSIDFDFAPFETRFEEHFADFLKFKEKYGHALIPNACNEYPSLGSWAVHCRSKGVRPDRKERLDKEGFVWDAIDEKWQNFFIELAEYKKIKGHTKFSRKEGYGRLQYWAARLRSLKRSTTGPQLSEEQIKLLDSIGFDWEPLDADWNRHFEKLLEFINKYNHPYVKAKDCEIEGLGSWVSWLRCNKNNLSKEKIAQLDSVGFEWDTYEALKKRNRLNNPKPVNLGRNSKENLDRLARMEVVWQKKFDEVIKYRDKYGTLNVPNDSYKGKDKPGNGNLHNWIHKQRVYFRDGMLSKSRYEKLVAVGFDFDRVQSYFEKHFANLIKFKEKYGHTLATRSYPDFRELGCWAERMRTLKVRDDQRIRLEEIGFYSDIEKLLKKRKTSKRKKPSD